MSIDGDYSEGAILLERFVKICRLCGALNVASQERCAKCGWEGSFDKRVETLQQAVARLFSVGEEEGRREIFRCVGLFDERGDGG